MNYRVVCHTLFPYRIEEEYIIKASNYSVGIRRAIEKFRKIDKLKGRRIDKIYVEAERLSGLTQA